MDQTKSRYYLFRTIGAREVLDYLKQFKLGESLIKVIMKYHKKAKDVEKIPLNYSEAKSAALCELAWKFFNEHDANPKNLKSKLERMMRKYHMSSEKVVSAYAGRVYTDARARLVIRDLSLFERREELEELRKMRRRSP